MLCQETFGKMLTANNLARTRRAVKREQTQKIAWQTRVCCVFVSASAARRVRARCAPRYSAIIEDVENLAVVGSKRSKHDFQKNHRGKAKDDSRRREDEQRIVDSPQLAGSENGRTIRRRNRTDNPNLRYLARTDSLRRYSLAFDLYVTPIHFLSFIKTLVIASVSFASLCRVLLL